MAGRSGESLTRQNIDLEERISCEAEALRMLRYSQSSATLLLGKDEGSGS